MFHNTVAAHANRFFRVMPINDGAAAFRNISSYGRSVTYDFLQRSIRLFEAVNKVDSEAGFYGARMVVAVGFRINYRTNLGEDVGLRDSIFRRLDNNSISTREAVHEAFRARPIYGFVEELQANFAFTKAYLVDAAGSKGGFGGPHCFIDLTMFTNVYPDWIDFSEIIDFETEGMSGRFGKLASFNRERAGMAKHAGILDAKEIRTMLEVPRVR